MNRRALFFYLAVAYAALSPIAANAGLTGRARTEIINVTVGKCFDAQRNYKINQPATDQELLDYCSCVANFYADQFSNEELIASKGVFSQEKIKGALLMGSQHCAR